MMSILRKELNSFLSSITGYMVVLVFLILNGLFLWVFPGTFNLLDAGYAGLDGLFFLAPWVFLFLIPALTMRFFSDELKTGTIELILTKPISEVHLVLGKFFAILTLLIIVLIPTFVYAYSIHELGNPVGNLDYGSISGSYIGLLLLASSFASIGIFTSTLTKNQVVAFLLGICVVFLFYYGFDAVSSLFGDYSYTIKLFGMNEHFKSVSRGVIDSRDVLYFMSIIIFFLFVSKQKLTNE